MHSTQQLIEKIDFDNKPQTQKAKKSIPRSSLQFINIIRNELINREIQKNDSIQENVKEENEATE